MAYAWLDEMIGSIRGIEPLALPAIPPRPTSWRTGIPANLLFNQIINLSPPKFPVPCSLFPIPCSLFPVPCSLYLDNHE
ncbi:hypothetical protein [Coleofasciculus sp. E1-EBD-02]|uniref:hypothetical protein n=1 Tax=Coleofasciculus sp. E1-EBD-02 TaxID=3068481 RepID=UPI0032FEC68C